MIPNLEIMSIFSVFPYALLFFAIPLISVGLALFAFKRADPRNSPALLSSLLVIFFSQLILLTLNLMIFQGFHQLSRIFPIAYRALTLINILWFIRALFWQPNRRAGWLIWALTALILLISSVLTLIWLPMAEQKSFNGSWEDLAWVGVTLLVIAISAIVYLRLDHSDRVEVIAILVLAAMGYVLYLALPNAGSLPSAVMISQLIYYPLLISLAWQRQLPAAILQPEPSGTEKRELSGEVAARLLDVSLQQTNTQIQRALTHSLGLYLMADLCGFLVSESGNLSPRFVNAYDLIREEFLPPVELPPAAFPVLLAHLEDRKLLIFSPDDALSREKSALMEAIGYNQIGNVLFYPLSPISAAAARGLLCLSPYTNRSWQVDSLRQLSQIAPKINEILDSAANIEQRATSAQHLQLMVNQLQRDRANTLDQLNQSRVMLLELQQDLQQQSQFYESEVDLWLSRQETLESQLDELQRTLRQNEAALLGANALKAEKEQLERLIAQNALQVDGLRSALEQARGLLEQISPMPPVVAKGANLELESALKAQIAEFADASSAKQITARVKNALPAEPSPLHRDRLLILSRALLQNAFSASKPGSEIELELLPSEEYAGFTELRVSDTGSGFKPEEQSAFVSLLNEPAADQLWEKHAALREAVSLARSLGGHWWIHSVPDSITIHRLAIPAENEAGEDD